MGQSQRRRNGRHDLNTSDMVGSSADDIGLGPGGGGGGGAGLIRLFTSDPRIIFLTPDLKRTVFLSSLYTLNVMECPTDSENPIIRTAISVDSDGKEAPFS